MWSLCTTKLPYTTYLCGVYELQSCPILHTHRRSKRYGRSGFGRTTFWPMTTPTIISKLCACSEFFNRGHRELLVNLVAALLDKWTALFLVSLINHQLHSPSPNDHLGRRHLFFAVFSMLNWFKQWTFLHYDEAKDLVHCYTCLLCFKEKQLRSANADPAFVSSLNYVNNLIWITRKAELFNVASCP